MPRLRRSSSIRSNVYPHKYELNSTLKTYGYSQVRCMRFVNTYISQRLSKLLMLNFLRPPNMRYLLHDLPVDEYNRFYELWLQVHQYEKEFFCHQASSLLAHKGKPKMCSCACWLLHYPSLPLNTKLPNKENRYSR